MKKRSEIRLLIYFLAVPLAAVLLSNFVLATAINATLEISNSTSSFLVTNTTPAVVLQGGSYYNFTFVINNTNLTSINASVPEVNITIPSNLTASNITLGYSETEQWYWSNVSNGTSYGSLNQYALLNVPLSQSGPGTWNFVWTNATNLTNETIVPNGTVGYFTFNMTFEYIGNLTVNVSTVNYDGVVSSSVLNISFVDNYPPNASFVGPTPNIGTNQNGSTINMNYITANVSANDSVSAVEKVTIYLYNASGVLNLSSGSLNTAPYWYNFTGLNDEICAILQPC